MSDIFEPELELDQDPVGQDSVNSADSVDSVDTVEPVDPVDSSDVDGSALAEDEQSEKQSLVDSFLNMGIYNAMLLLSLIFIFLATLNMLGVLRTYNGSFPFSGGFPWSPNL